MAKSKAQRQSKKERKAEAKRRRLDELRRRARRQRLMRVYRWAGVVVVLGGIVAFALLRAQQGEKARDRLNELAAAAGCGSLQEALIEGQAHVSPPTNVSYRTEPPTSGNHYGSPGPTGILTAAIPNENQVHNLEHGHVGVQYQPAIDPVVITKLRNVARSNPEWIFMAPRPTMTAQVAFTGWGRLLTCDAPTGGEAVEKLGLEFVKQFRDKGPESIPGTPTRAGQQGVPPVTTSPAGGPAQPSPAATS